MNSKTITIWPSFKSLEKLVGWDFIENMEKDITVIVIQSDNVSKIKVNRFVTQLI